MARTTAEITDQDYEAARDFLVRKTGLIFNEGKRDELVSVLQDRLALLSRFEGVGEYLASLEREDDGGRELRGLVSRLTVGETYFFRNHAQFEALRDNILPSILERRRRRERKIRIWSAGCSTGEEPYSVAILLHELVPDLPEWEVHLLATDINEDSLAAARSGLYRNWSFREVEERYRSGYFTAEADGLRILPEIRRLVTFRYLNLADDLFPAAVTGTDALDLVLCRNVMIYFRPDLCREITRRFYLALEPDGHLVVGHSEHSDLVYGGFSRSFLGGTMVYRKAGPNPAWEKGIAIRYRGSGPLVGRVVTHDAPGPRATGVQRPPGTEETVRFERAATLVAEMRPGEAIAEFKRVVAINPGNERALYSVAMLLANAGDDAGAIGWLARLLERNPLHLEGNYLLAIVSRETGERERELACLKKTVYINPDFTLGHFQLGVHYLRAGNERLARRSFLNALRLLGGRAPGEAVAGVEGMTVGRLREAVAGMIPGGPPAEAGA